MIVRDYKPEDLGRIEEMFAKQSFDYQLPEMGVFVEKIVVEVEGRAVMAVSARPTVELYFIGDPEWGTPGMRYEAFKKVHDEMRKRLAIQGYDDAHAWIPPRIARAFGRRLLKFGCWIQSKWVCYTGFTGRSDV